MNALDHANVYIGASRAMSKVAAASARAGDRDEAVTAHLLARLCVEIAAQYHEIADSESEAAA